MKLRTLSLTGYHRDLSRRVAKRANEKMRDRFVGGAEEYETFFAKQIRQMRHRTRAQVSGGWNPLVGWWDKGIGVRLRGTDSTMLGNEAYREEITEMVVEATIDEIMADPAPFVAQLLEDQALAEEPFYEEGDQSLLERMRDQIGRRR